MHIFHTITHIFITYLFPVSNLALVKPEKANAVENYLIQMARFGKLGGKVRQKEQNTVCFLSSPWQNYKQTFLFSDFWVRLNRDSRKSQSANGEKDHSYSKSPWNVLKPSIQFLSISPHTALCAWLAVQQTEGDGLRRRGWLLSLDKSAGMRQKKNPGGEMHCWDSARISDSCVLIKFLGCHTTFCVLGTETTKQKNKDVRLIFSCVEGDLKEAHSVHKGFCRPMIADGTVWLLLTTVLFFLFPSLWLNSVLQTWDARHSFYLNCSAINLFFFYSELMSC